MLTRNADAICASCKRIDRVHTFCLESLFDVRGRQRHVIVAYVHTECLCLPSYLALNRSEPETTEGSAVRVARLFADFEVDIIKDLRVAASRPPFSVAGQTEAR